MSRTTSPQSRPTRRQSRPRLTQTSAPAPKARADRPTTISGKIRRFLPALAVADALVLVLIIIAAFVSVMVAAAPLAALPATIADMWMVSHLAPVVYDDVTVGMLPLLPAIGVVAAVASRVRSVLRSKVSVLDIGVALGCTLVVPAILTVVAWLMLWDAAKVYDVGPPPILQALATTIVVHLVAFVLGLGPRLWKALFKRYRLPVPLVDGMSDAFAFARYLALAALVVMLLLAVFGLDRQRDMLASFPDSGGATLAALVVLSILYLPNALVGMASVLLGADVAFGGAQVSLFSIHLVPLPPTPLTALIPGSANPYAPALLLVTATAAAYAWVKAKPSLMQILGGALGAGVIMLVLVVLSGGTLGWYGYVGPTWWLAPLLAAVWMGGSGLATYAALLFAQRRGVQGPGEEPVAEETHAEETDAETAEPAEVEGDVDTPPSEPESAATGSTRFDKSQLEADSDGDDPED